MTVDATARNVSATVTILDGDRNSLGGPYDLSTAIAAAKVTIAGVNLQGPNGYRPWTAELILENGITAESIDARDVTASPSGASLLAQGNAVDLRIFDGGSFKREWPTLYILRVPSPIDPLSAGEQSTTIELGDITQLENTSQPEGNLSGMVLGTSYSRHTIANNILSARNLPTSADTIAGYQLSVPTQKLGTNAWPNEIGRLAGTAGYFFWIDKDDNARFTPIDLNKSAPDFSLTIGVDEVAEDGWKRANLSERPPVELVVTGTGGRAIAKDNPEVITTVSSEKETTFTRTISVLSSRVTEVFEERLSERTILPRIPTQGSSGGLGVVSGYTENTSTSLRLARRETVVEDYSSNTKELRTLQRTVEIAKAMAGGDAFRETDTLSDAYELLKVEQSTITYRYRDGRLSDRETSTQRPWTVIRWANVRPNNYEANRFLTQTNLTKEEEWSKRLFGGGQWKYEFETQRPQGELKTYYGAALNADVLRQSPSESDAIESNEDGPARPPATKYMPLLYEQDNQQYEGSIDITPLAGQAHKNRLRTVAIQGPYVVSNAQCEFLAEIIGSLEHGRSLGQQFVGAIPQWIIDSFSPGARVDVTDNGVVKSYFLDGWTITADATETLWGCSLAELGTVGAAPEDVTPPISIAKSSNATGGELEGGSATFVEPETFSLTGGELEGGASTFESTTVLLTGGELEGAATEFRATTLELVGGAIEGGSAELIAPDPDAEAYIARLTGTYTQTELDAIRDLFTTLKDQGIYTAGDVMQICALDNATDAALNLFSTSYTLTPINMTFTARQGFTGNGSTSYISTGFVPSSAGGNYSLNGSSLGTYLRLNIAEITMSVGVRSTAGSDTRAYIFPRRNSPSNEYRSLVNAASVNISGTTTDSRRLYVTSRTAANLTTLYREGSSLGTSAEASIALPTREVYFAGYNNDGALALSSTNEVAFTWIGGSLNQVQVTALTSAIDDLLTVFGANV